MLDRVAARRYARALFEAVTGLPGRKQILKDLKATQALAADVPDLLPTLDNPALPLERRLEMVDDISQRLALQESSGRFWHLLVERKRVTLLGEITLEYERLLAVEEGQVQVTVASASKLSSVQLSRLGTILQKKTGRRVGIENVIEPGLMAGLSVRIGDMELDVSLDTSLNRLQAQLLKG
jgi:F-type H+-transporting ATPase subunit delta